MHPDLILHNGRVTTLDRSNPNATAIAIKDGLFLAVGSGEQVSGSSLMPMLIAGLVLIAVGYVAEMVLV